MDNLWSKISLTIFQISLFIIGSTWGFFVLATTLPYCANLSDQYQIMQVTELRYLLVGIIIFITAIGVCSFFKRGDNKFALLIAFATGQGIGMGIYSALDYLLIFNCFNGIPNIPHFANSTSS